MTLWTDAPEVLNPHPRSRTEIITTGVPTRSELSVAKDFRSSDHAEADRVGCSSPRSTAFPPTRHRVLASS